jgi:hypothetical protein
MSNSKQTDITFRNVFKYLYASLAPIHTLKAKWGGYVHYPRIFSPESPIGKTQRKKKRDKIVPVLN